MVTIDDVAALAHAFPGVTEGTRWGHRTWQVGRSGFAWVRPFSKADLKRFGDAPVPSGEIVALRVDDLGEKEAVLAAGRPGFFDIAHFAGAGLGSQNSCLCSDSRRRWMARAACTWPSIAATHSSCISRGATLAVTLTLPWPPSSISAIALPSSPE